jgi:hypothetical protein
MGVWVVRVRGNGKGERKTELTCRGKDCTQLYTLKRCR